MRAKTLALWESIASKLHIKYENDKVDFGRYQGKKPSDLQASYLKWFSLKSQPTD